MCHVIFLAFFQYTVPRCYYLCACYYAVSLWTRFDLMDKGSKGHCSHNGHTYTHKNM